MKATAFIGVFFNSPVLFLGDLIRPIFSVQTSVLHRLRDMRGLYILAFVQIGYGAGDAQDLVISTRGKPQLFKTELQQIFRIRRKNAEFARHARRHFGIAGNLRARKALSLYLPRAVYPFPYGSGAFFFGF